MQATCEEISYINTINMHILNIIYRFLHCRYESLRKWSGSNEYTVNSYSKVVVNFKEQIR